MKKFNLDKRNAVLAGVCSGIANYTGIDTFWVRLATVLGTIFGIGSLVIVYIIVALIAQPQEYGA